MALPFPIPAGLFPAFTMAAPTEADAESLAEIYYEAFRTDPSNTYWWPAEKEPMMQWMVPRIRNKMRDRSVRHFKVVDAQTGDMVAFARWDIPEGSIKFGEWLGGGGEADVSELVKGEGEPANGAAPAALTGGTEAPQPTSAPMEIPPGADAELCRDFFDGLSRMSSKWVTPDMLGKQRSLTMLR